MPRKKVNIGHLDRVRRPDEKAASATVITVHGSEQKVVAYSVLLDEGPKQTHVWEPDETVLVSGPIRTCARCSTPGHIAIYCKENL